LGCRDQCRSQHDRRPLRGTSGLISIPAPTPLSAGQRATRFLLLAAKPLREPIARYGPFVMNTHEELTQAFDDYRHGTLTRKAA
jgi:redox-sensitive bicupin YhaK (pirin superfamily)